MRGGATIADMNRNVARLRPKLRMAHWNAEGFKIGICAKPPVGLPFSLLCLANNSCIAGTLDAMVGRFEKLYRRKLFVHHYEEYGMDAAGFGEATEALTSLVDEYRAQDAAAPAPVMKMAPRGASFV